MTDAELLDMKKEIIEMISQNKAAAEAKGLEAYLKNPNSLSLRKQLHENQKHIILYQFFNNMTNVEFLKIAKKRHINLGKRKKYNNGIL